MRVHKVGSRVRGLSPQYSQQDEGDNVAGKGDEEEGEDKAEKKVVHQHCTVARGVAGC